MVWMQTTWDILMFNSLYKSFIDDVIGTNHSIMASDGGGVEHNVAESLISETRDITKLRETENSFSVHTTSPPANMSAMTQAYPNTSHIPMNETLQTVDCGNETSCSMDHNESWHVEPFHLMNNNEMTAWVIIIRFKQLCSLKWKIITWNAIMKSYNIWKFFP